MIILKAKYVKMKVVIKVTTEILAKTYDVLDEIKSSALFLDLVELNQLIEFKYEELLKEYHKKFKLFKEAFNIGPYYPDYQKILKDYQKVKMKLYLKEEVKDYFKLEERLNKYLEELMTEIADCISPYILKKELGCFVK